MSRHKINAEGKLYYEVVRRCEYHPTGESIVLTEEQKEQLRRAIDANGGRPVEASPWLPRRWGKNEMTG